MDRLRIGIVIPALNESATIASVVKGVVADGLPIVVDDGSSDQTGALAQAAGATVVRHPVNRGYDRALDSGFVRASELGCDYVVTMDADGQHDPTLLRTFLRAIDEGAQIVVGIRDRRQRLAEHVFAWVGRWLWGMRDPLCGMKAYHISIYRQLGHFDSYESIGTELAIFAARSGRHIVQVPVRTRDRMGAPRFGRRFQANVKIFRALWRALAGGANARVPAPPRNANE